MQFYGLFIRLENLHAHPTNILLTISLEHAVITQGHGTFDMLFSNSVTQYFLIFVSDWPHELLGFLFVPVSSDTTDDRHVLR